MLTRADTCAGVRLQVLRDTRDKLGRTALFTASILDRDQSAVTLLALGSDPAVRDKYQESCLQQMIANMPTAAAHALKCFCQKDKTGRVQNYFLRDLLSIKITAATAGSAAGTNAGIDAGSDAGSDAGRAGPGRTRSRQSSVRSNSARRSLPVRTFKNNGQVEQETYALLVLPITYALLERCRNTLPQCVCVCVCVCVRVCVIPRGFAGVATRAPHAGRQHVRQRQRNQLGRHLELKGPRTFYFARRVSG